MGEVCQVEYLIIGAGVSGLAFASRLEKDSFLIVEKEDKIGGYCKTFKEDGFVWDYAGHFFHFTHPEIKEKFAKLLNDEKTVYNSKNTKIYYKDKYIDYPFQFNIHQLEKEEFIDCLCGLFEDSGDTGSAGFKEMLYAELGKGISDKFLIPYNEKLYSCDLNSLDINAMGRFFPKADPVQIVKSFRGSQLKTYNDEFFYSGEGAEAFVNALAQDVRQENVLTSEEVLKINSREKIAYTADREIHYTKLINTMPFDRLLDIADIPHKEKYTANKVLVFNMGFDTPPEDKDIHWVYYPDKELVFYRVGFYNNILHQKRMSLYVEIGLSSADDVDIDEYKARVLHDLEKAGVITTQKLLACHALVMDPAYVHISEKSQKEKEDLMREMAQKDMYSIGRYGNWTYCSIEDCIWQAYTLFDTLKKGNI